MEERFPLPAEEGCALVLAGGRSRRMGPVKALVPLRGRPLVLWAVEALRPLFSTILLVAREVEPLRSLGLPLVRDDWPAEGPLVGVYSGLRACPAPWALAVGCDMPFLQPGLLRALLARAGEAEALFPRVAGWVYPFPAVYSRRCLPAIQALLQEGKRGPYHLGARCRSAFLEEGEVRRADPDLLSLRDLDTPQDLAWAETLVAGRKYNLGDAPRGEMQSGGER